MNRREFIGSSVAAFASPFVFGAEKLPMTVSGKHLPSWAFEQIAEGLERFRAWKGRDEVISFPMTTNCHSRYYALSDNYFDYFDRNDTESEVKAKAKVETAKPAEADPAKRP